MATSPLYELTVSQVSDGEDDVRGKVVSILKHVSDSTIAVVSIVNKHAAPTGRVSDHESPACHKLKTRWTGIDQATRSHQ